MKYRKLGNTELIASEIGFGTWGIGGKAYGQVDDDESRRALEVAFEKGVTLYDTADLYGDGHAEELLGEVFSKIREKIVIVSKGGTLPHTTFYMPQDFSSSYVTKALERSLKRLRTDYIDLYLLHSPTLEDIRSHPDLLPTLEALRSEGKLRMYGISARTPADAMIAITEFGFQVVEVNFNMIDHRAVELGLFARVEKESLGLIVRTPLTFGYLTGALKGSETFESTDHRKNWPKDQLSRWAQAPKLFSFLSEGNHRTPAQAALRFCLDFKAVSTVIPGMMNVREVAEDTAVSEMPSLTEQEMAQIVEIYKNHDFYDRSFQKVKSDGKG